MAAISTPSLSERFDFTAPLWNPTTQNTIAYADQVVDRTDGIAQATINSNTAATLARIEKLAKAGIVL